MLSQHQLTDIAIIIAMVENGSLLKKRFWSSAAKARKPHAVGHILKKNADDLPVGPWSIRPKMNAGAWSKRNSTYDQQAKILCDTIKYPVLEHCIMVTYMLQRYYTVASIPHSDLRGSIMNLFRKWASGRFNGHVTRKHELGGQNYLSQHIFPVLNGKLLPEFFVGAGSGKPLPFAHHTAILNDLRYEKHIKESNRLATLRARADIGIVVGSSKIYGVS